MWNIWHPNLVIIEEVYRESEPIVNNEFTDSEEDKTKKLMWLRLQYLALQAPQS